MPDVRELAMRSAREILATMPDHDDHLHAVVVGLALAPDNADPQLVVVVQGIDHPVWVGLDDDDLAGIRRYMDLTDRDRELPN